MLSDAPSDVGVEEEVELDSERVEEEGLLKLLAALPI